MKILITTQEGYQKDQSPLSKQKRREKQIHLAFSGNRAPVNAVRAMMEKFGVTKDEI